jgi:4-diphosphocytidyl-2-C-methyl-D-erythritol kinase
MISFPNAKINIGLSIISARSDGYHNIESIFYPVDWCDVLEILPAKETTFISSGVKIPSRSDDNLCLKAYELLREEFNIAQVSIHLQKNIPIGAGLGGGSSDAAFTLKMLNEMFDLNLSSNQLEDRAKSLGSDCAFFIKNKPMLATEKGDVFQDVKLNLKGYYLLLVNPNIHVSTKEAYGNITPHSTKVDFSLIEELDEKLLVNDFEKTVMSNHPEIERIKKELQKEAIYTSMTGSGSTVFGVFEKKPLMNEFESYATHLQLIK